VYSRLPVSPIFFPVIKKRAALDENKESRRRHSKKGKQFFLSLKKKRKGERGKIKESIGDADG